MYRFDPFFWGDGGFGVLFMIACAIVFVLLLVWIVRRTENTHHHVAPPPGAPGPGPYGSGGPAGWPGYGAPSGSPGAGYAAPSPAVDPALQILRERFARGEITEAEFLSISRTLAGPHP